MAPAGTGDESMIAESGIGPSGCSASHGNSSMTTTEGVAGSAESLIRDSRLVVRSGG